ncbi:MAG: hypothetical protein PW792_16950 [Acidobacteriaceae bacterium]|nr:hypothetical protein [Acidobacteriaceae bacterium]
MRTYLYKLTSDRGGAPCAPPPQDGEEPLLSLSICKPAIRRTAEPGDRILGITSQALHANEGYPLLAVLYAAVVDRALEPREYYATGSQFTTRPDCIYEFHQQNARLAHSGRTPLHNDPAYLARDIGSYPYYKNARTLLSYDFRYFGSAAIVIPARLPLLRHAADSLGQGHRVYDQSSPEAKELDALFRLLWKQPTRHTPATVEHEAPGHTPRPGKRKTVAL